MRLTAFTLAIAFTFSLAAQTAPEKIPSVTLPPELDRVLRDYEAGWQAKDASKLASIFTDDGFVLGNGKAPVRGRDAIKAAYAESGGPLALRAMSYSIDGSTGWIIGAFASAKDADDAGKFILALRKVDGKWLIAADIDNMNRRPQRQVATPAQ